MQADHSRVNGLACGPEPLTTSTRYIGATPIWRRVFVVSGSFPMKS